MLPLLPPSNSSSTQHIDSLREMGIWVWSASITAWSTVIPTLLSGKGSSCECMSWHRAWYVWFFKLALSRKLTTWMWDRMASCCWCDNGYYALTGQIGLPEAPTTQEVADSGPTVIKQADVPVSEVGLDLDQPVTPELKQRPRTRESVDIEETPSPAPISSIHRKKQGLIHLFNPTKPYLRRSN